MIEQNRANLEKFLTLAAPNLNRNCWAEVASLYLKSGRTAVNLATRIALVPANESPASTKPMILELPAMKAIKGLVPPSHVRPLLDGLAEGALNKAHLPDGCHDTIELARPSLGTLVSFGRDRTIEYGIDFPTHILWVGGEEVPALVNRECWDEMDARVPAADPPFPSLSALVSAFGIATGIQHSHSTMVSVLSPYWLRIEDVFPNRETGTVRLKVLSRWVELESKASVSLVPRLPGDAPPVLRSLDGPEWTVNPEEGGFVHSADIQLPRHAGPWTLSLNYDGRRIDSVEAGLPSPRLVAHSMFDPELQLLRKWLAGSGRKDSESFERAVTWLLHICGLSAVRVGFKDLIRSPDVLAFFDRDTVLCIECTTELPGLDKLAHLASRAEELRTILQDRCGGVVTLPLLCIAKRSLDLPEERRDAIRRMGVAPLCLDDLEALLAMAERDEDPRTILTSLERKATWPYS